MTHVSFVGGAGDGSNVKFPAKLATGYWGWTGKMTDIFAAPYFKRFYTRVLNALLFVGRSLASMPLRPNKFGCTLESVRVYACSYK